MKKIIFFAVIATCMLAGATVFAQQNERIHTMPVGSELPEELMKQPLPSVTGQPVSLAGTMTSKGLIVMFSCNTCPYVIKSQQRTKEVMKYAKEKGIGMVILNSNEAQRNNDDGEPQMIKYALAQGYTVPYLVDVNSTMANILGATHTPEVFLFNNKGKIVYEGAMEDNPSNPGQSKKMYLKDAIDALVQGKTPAITTTKSIGCGIKRNS